MIDWKKKLDFVLNSDYLTDPSAPGRREFSPICVTINDGKPLHSYCADCGKMGTLHVNLKRCTRCKSVAYCGRECQVQDYKNHKQSCKAIDSAQVMLTSEAMRLSDNHGFDAFSVLGVFWEARDTRNYCTMRLVLINLLMKESKLRCKLRCTPGGRVNELALHLALEHMKDLNECDHFDHQGVRFDVPGAMIALRMHEQAYSFLKFYFSEDESQLDAGWMRCRVTAHQFLDMALVKLCIFSEIRAAQILSQRFVANDDILGIVTGLTNVPKNWHEIDTGSLLTQARQLLTRVHEKNKHILPAMMDPIKFEGMDVDDSSTEEAEIALQRSFHLWKSNRVAYIFISNFAKNIERSRLPIHRLVK